MLMEIWFCVLFGGNWHSAGGIVKRAQSRVWLFFSAGVTSLATSNYYEVGGWNDNPIHALWHIRSLNTCERNVLLWIVGFSALVSFPSLVTKIEWLVRMALRVSGKHQNHGRIKHDRGIAEPGIGTRMLPYDTCMCDRYMLLPGGTVSYGMVLSWSFE